MTINATINSDLDWAFILQDIYAVAAFTCVVCAIWITVEILKELR